MPTIPITKLSCDRLEKIRRFLWPSLEETSATRGLSPTAQGIILAMHHHAGPKGHRSTLDLSIHLLPPSEITRVEVPDFVHEMYCKMIRDLCISPIVEASVGPMALSQLIDKTLCDILTGTRHKISAKVPLSTITPMDSCIQYILESSSQLMEQINAGQKGFDTLHAIFRLPSIPPPSKTMHPLLAQPYPTMRLGSVRTEFQGAESSELQPSLQPSGSTEPVALELTSDSILPPDAAAADPPPPSGMPISRRPLNPAAPCSKSPKRRAPRKAKSTPQNPNVQPQDSKTAPTATVQADVPKAVPSEPLAPTMKVPSTPASDVAGSGGPNTTVDVPSGSQSEGEPRAVQDNRDSRKMRKEPKATRALTPIKGRHSGEECKERHGKLEQKPALDASPSAATLRSLSKDKPGATADIPTTQSPKDNPLGSRKDELGGAALIGKRVRAYWEAEQQWFEGTIIKYKSRKNEHIIQYDDGEREKVKLPDETIQVLE